MFDTAPKNSTKNGDDNRGFGACVDACGSIVQSDATAKLVT
jgi:hypothetical protein